MTLVKVSVLTVTASCVLALTFCARAQDSSQPLPKKPFSDYRTQRPGTVHKITVADLPQPGATRSSTNDADVVRRPKDAWPKVPQGFEVELYAEGLRNPRLLRTASNGDLFLADSRAGEIKIFRGITAQGKPEQMQVFASDLRQPFGIAFYPPTGEPQWVYVANTNSVVRFPYRNGDLKARGASEKIVDLSAGGRLHGGGHWTRDVAFSKDGKKMYVSVGSLTNNDDPEENEGERERANILEFNPDGSGKRIYASGVRNAVGIATDPNSGELWMSVNERDGLGDNLVPDYISSVKDGGFYGWPYYYMGGNYDPDHKGKKPELKSKVITPDVLLQPHNASLQLTFYTGEQFPEEYRGDIFAAEHGSWNKRVRTGYEVIRVPREGSKATGEYIDFMTGFVTPGGEVWGRPVGVAVGKDGSLFVSDDGSKSIWRVTYTGK